MPKAASKGTAVLARWHSPVPTAAAARRPAPRQPLHQRQQAKRAGTIHTIATNALRYNTNKGVWYQYIQKFDAALLKPGVNEMTFTVPAGDVTTGVVWDYLRLELNDGSKPYPNPPDNPIPDYPAVP